jgi:hypothetical protein
MNLSVRKTGNAEILRHFVQTEIKSRGLDAQTAVGETARAFGILPADIQQIILNGTGYESLEFSNFTEIHHGRLLKNDLVLNAAAGTENADTPGAFNRVKMDGNLLVQQCHLVLRLDVADADSNFQF